ncbi:ketopantoate reductase family protein [Bordetella sp. 2513F-2]
MNELSGLRICVAGAGAVGGTLAARLARAGHQVSVLARGATLAALRRDGLCLHDRSGCTRVHVPASDQPEFGPQDAIFLCAKAHSLAPLVRQAWPMVAGHTVLVPAVNGVPWWYFQGETGPLAGQAVRAVDPEGWLLANVPWRQLLGCVVYITAESPAPGVVVSRTPHRLVLGEPDNQPGERLSRLCALLRLAGIDAEPAPRIRDAIWTKLAANLSSNPLSVITGATLRQIYGPTPLRELAAAVIGELDAVAQAHGARLMLPPAELLALGERMGDFRTSMLQDYENGRPLELAAIGDAVLELAGRHHLPMPTTRAVLALARYRALPHAA